MGMYEFAEGESAIGVGFINDRSRNGMRCQIIGSLDFREWEQGRSRGKSACYLVRWADGTTSAQEPANLKAQVRERDPGPAWGYVGLNPVGAFA